VRYSLRHSTTATATTSLSKMSVVRRSNRVSRRINDQRAEPHEVEEWRQLMSQEMYATFLAVHRNDSTATAIDTLPHYSFTGVEEQIGLPLGSALASNSHVTTLSISMNHVHPRSRNEGEWFVQLRTWIRSSRSLRNVTMVDGADDERFSCLIFDDISRNSNLEVVRVESPFRFASLVRLLRSARALRTLQFGCCACVDAEIDDPDNDQHRRELAEAFAANSTLEELSVQHWFGEFSCISIEALLGTWSNYPRLRDLQLNTNKDFDQKSPSFMRTLQSFFASTASLCHFSIQFLFDNESIIDLLEGFRACRSLTKASFHDCVFMKMPRVYSFLIFVQQRYYQLLV
jgi:hypothetical protein